MKSEKEKIINELITRINGSPFMLIADYTGLTVRNFSELRNRLHASGSQCHVVKNSYIKKAAREAQLPEGLDESLTGQTAVVTGDEDVCAAAKVLKNFAAEFEKPAVRMGVLDGKLLTAADVTRLASLPSREVLLSQLLGLMQAPATNLARLINEPGSMMARLVKAYSEKEG